MNKAMKIHHTTKSEYGTCTICGKPILQLWFNKEETRGRSETVQEKKGGNNHYVCAGGKSLHQLNEERKLLYYKTIKSVKK